MFSSWIYVVVAFAIALVAFGVGQFVPGAGVPVIILTSTAWTAYAVMRKRQLGAC